MIVVAIAVGTNALIVLGVLMGRSKKIRCVL